MKVALCCIGRLENQYAVEFVEHYKSLGFDKIFIYDNNHNGEEHFEDVLQKHIDDDFVKIIDYRNIEKAQFMAYNDCYHKYGNDYNFMAFFDFDEFLFLTKDKNIKEYVSRFEDADIIKINWMLYTDNNLIENDGRPLLERFTEPMDYDKNIEYGFPENNLVKSIVKTGVLNINFKMTPHIPLFDVYDSMVNGLKENEKVRFKVVNSIGKPSDFFFYQPYDFSLAYLKHFRTKTIDEWVNNKVVRGVGDREYEVFKETYPLYVFFQHNEKTQEKMNFLKDRNIEYADYKRPVKYFKRDESINVSTEKSSGKVEFKNRTNRMIL